MLGPFDRDIHVVVDCAQDPPYQSISDDPDEEKLDDSTLPWEQTLEFEEDFALDASFGSRLRTKALRNKRVSRVEPICDHGDPEAVQRHGVVTIPAARC